MLTYTDKDLVGNMEIPEALQGSLCRHRENLASLVANMQAVGFSETQIEESVSVIISSYKEELLRTIKAMVR